MNNLEDHSLMLKVKEGQLDKLGLLYERYKLRLFGFFYKMTNEGAISEDLVQNVFVRIQNYSHSYHENGNFKTWIFHIARNVAYDHFKKAKKYQFEEDMTGWDHELIEERNIETDISKMDDLGKLKYSLSKMIKEKQELIHMAKIDGLKYHEIAEMYGCSEGALKVRIHRTLGELKEIFHSLSHA
ncbi:MAG: RNA polymerase sigma factor [bacterium]|nr:RNA polymerase sigma factor [bacterium]